MDRDDLRRFLASVRRTRFIDYLDPMGETAKAALERRIKWAHAHANDPGNADEAEFIVHNGEELFDIVAQEELDDAGEWVESSEAGAEDFAPGMSAGWITSKVSLGADLRLEFGGIDADPETDETEEADPFAGVDLDAPMHPHEDDQPDFAPTSITRLEDLTDPPPMPRIEAPAPPDEDATLVATPAQMGIGQAEGEDEATVVFAQETVNALIAEAAAAAAETVRQATPAPPPVAPLPALAPSPARLAESSSEAAAPAMFAASQAPRRGVGLWLGAGAVVLIALGIGGSWALGLWGGAAAPSTLSGADEDVVAEHQPPAQDDGVVEANPSQLAGASSDVAEPELGGGAAEPAVEPTPEANEPPGAGLTAGFDTSGNAAGSDRPGSSKSAKPRGSKPATSSSVKPSKPAASRGAKHSKPAASSSAKPSKPAAPRGAKPASTSSAKSASTSSAKPASTSSVKPATSTGAKPASSSGAKPVTTSGAKPVASSGAKPTTTSGAIPAASSGVKPTATSAAKPATTSGAKPAASSTPSSTSSGSAPGAGAAPAAGTKPAAGASSPPAAGSKPVAATPGPPESGATPTSEPTASSPTPVAGGDPTGTTISAGSGAAGATGAQGSTPAEVKQASAARPPADVQGIWVGFAARTSFYVRLDSQQGPRVSGSVELAEGEGWRRSNVQGTYDVASGLLSLRSEDGAVRLDGTVAGRKARGTLLWGSEPSIDWLVKR